MIRQDPAYWQRLRKDVPSNAAALLAAVAALAATLCAISMLIAGTQFDARANPLYWLLMLPMAYWVSGLTTFAPRYVRSWTWVMMLAAAISVVCAALSMRDGVAWTAQAIGCLVTIAAALASLLLHRNSLVAREGPAR